MKLVILIVVLGTYGVASGLLYHAAFNERSRKVRFRPRHLWVRRSIDDSSRLQLAIEAAVGVGIATAALLWIL